ncbi:AMP-binding protein [Belnapia sp. T6]|uniref:AMP-binding protein n=1 Tax=Belnapia mucosa TaxID=2804532 RepID=A0ABS1V820_9PROT|nr:AMP-binding protein [Belnapia mucosa]MBL6457818.1 AMP-binding protein [Belnapia mucosa]
MSGGNPFLDPLLRRRREEPDAPFALLHGPAGWEEYPFAALFDRALQFAALYRARGVKPGGLVFLMLRHGQDLCAGFLGGMLAGAMPSFLPPPTPKQDPALYWRQHRTLLAQTAPAAILAEEALHAPIAAMLGEATPPLLRCAEADALPAVLPASLPDADAIALLQHSSGTTGLKKGVALSYRAIALQLDAYAERLGLRAPPAIASWLPLYHDMGLITGLLLPLWLGGRIAAMDPFAWVGRPALLFEGVTRIGASHVWLPNFAFHLLARTVRRVEGLDLSSVEAWTNCSEPCRPDAFAAFLARFAHAGVREESLRTCYAMAETVFAVAQAAPGAPVRRLTLPDGRTLLSNGPPLAGCEVEARGEAGPLPPGEIGELCIRAPFLFTGYNRNPEATAAALAEGWYRTGDLGLVEDGEVFVTGRIKDLIIVAGKNIHAHDVEAALQDLPGLKPGRAVAFGQDDPDLGTERLVVVAEREEGADAASLVAAINGAVLDALGIACGAVQVVEPGWLVKTTSGKISRESNAARYAALRAKGDPHGRQS